LVAKTVALPNIKKCFIPDKNYIIGDFDLEKADAQVVAWESGDESLKQMFRERVNINKEEQKNLKCTYKEAKMGIHLSNYGGKPPTLAKALGCTVHFADEFQKRWFGAHPKIKEWHERVERELQETRTVTNAFGYKRYYFDRIEGVLCEALAWVPQSTVALVIDKAMLAIDRDLYPKIHILLQVHDSLVCQWPRAINTWALREIGERMHIVIPYDDPLVIPSSADTSPISWGDVSAVEWPEGTDTTGIKV